MKTAARLYAAERIESQERAGSAHLLAWLLIYYQDDGAMFSPQISRRRKRITIGGVEYWLVRVPKPMR